MTALLPETSRRVVLRALAGAPLLPLAGGFAFSGTWLAAREAVAAALPKSAEFMAMAAPSSPAAQATTTVESSMAVTYSDGTSQTFKLAYQPLFFTGDQVPDGKGGTTLAGGYYDIAGKPVMDASAEPPVQFFSDCPDGYSLLKLSEANVPGVSGNTLFAVAQFEYTTRDAKDEDVYQQLPSPIAVLTLDQDKETGALKLVKYSTVDTSPAHGLWTTCGASLSPWNTHLASEEYEPDATAISSNKAFKGFSRSLFGDETRANPYHYGHLPEITVAADGTGTVKKHYCLGRLSHEVIQVMPDQRTAFMGDDATNGGLFMFVADKDADLSAGTLYVGIAKQRAGDALDKGGAFDLTWIMIGHATSDEIEKLADTLKASDILHVAKEDPKDETFKRIGFSGKPQWVKFKPGMEKAAAYLETHRWAGAIGGTLAFTKLEGVTVNAKDKIAYAAMSYIYKTMSDGKWGIQVNEIKAGAVYQLPMKGGQMDTSGKAIDSEWVPVTLSTVPALVGKDLATPDAIGNTADVDLVANPDNLKYSERLRTLFIGEDSGNHVNNFLWAYNVDSGKLSRLLSCPAAAESTGLQAVDDLNGFAYIMSNFQHAGDWEKGLHDKVKAELAPLIDQQYRKRRSAAVGYIQGLPQPA